MQKIRVFEAFAGYGSQFMALKRLNLSCSKAESREKTKRVGRVCHNRICHKFFNRLILFLL